jgi:hypothetical protein
MHNRHMSISTPLRVMGLSTGYAAALAWLERRLPFIKPDHIWAEVAGGVLVSLLPVALAARQSAAASAATDDLDEPLTWQTYESTVWRSFWAAGVPIVLWQLGEAVVRQHELLKYTYNRHDEHDTLPFKDFVKRGIELW